MTNLVEFPGLGLEFTLNRVAFTLFGMPIYWYGIILASGLLLGVLFAFRYAPDFGIDTDRLIDVVVIGTLCSIACARAFYVAFAPFEYESVWDMINLRDGGIAIYGSVIGAAVFGGLACKWRKIPVIATFDLTALGFLIGQAVGRWGNFVNQEAFGSNTTLPWGMFSEATRRYLAAWQPTLAAEGVTVDPNLPVHPTFLYESIWCFVGLLLLWRHMKKRRFNGEIALLYVTWYGLGRVWIEGLRTDALMLPFGGLRVSQLIAAVSVLAAGTAVLLLRRKYRDSPLTVPLAVDEARRKAYQKQYLAKGGSGVTASAASLPASASHREFVEATKKFNDEAFDLSRIEERIAAEQQIAQEHTAPQEAAGEQQAAQPGPAPENVPADAPAPDTAPAQPQESDAPAPEKVPDAPQPPAPSAGEAEP